MRCQTRKVNCVYPQRSQDRGSRRARRKANNDPNPPAAQMRPTTLPSTSSRLSIARRGNFPAQRSHEASRGISPPPSLSWTDPFTSQSSDVFAFDELQSCESAVDGLFDDLSEEHNGSAKDFLGLDGFIVDFPGTSSPKKANQGAYGGLYTEVPHLCNGHSTSSDFDNTSNDR